MSAGKEAGDVVLFVQMVEALKEMTGGPESAAGSAARLTANAKTPINSVTGGVDLADGREGPGLEPAYLLPSTGTDDRYPPRVPDGDTAACDITLDSSSPGADSGPTTADDGDDNSAIAEDLLDGSSGDARDIAGDGGEGSGDEAEGDSVETAGATGERDSAPGSTKKKKKKKKNKSKRNKAGRSTWAGEEDAYGHRLTLRAEKEGGGVVVEGLPAVLAASDINPVLLEAARGQLCHAVGDPDVDNLIALGYLQVHTARLLRECIFGDVEPGISAVP